MNPELVNKITAAFPAFFIGRSKPDTESRMADGCSCDDGWYELIHNFCSETKQILDQARHVHSRNGEMIAHEPPKFEFVQIKEKLGTLRIYYNVWQPDAPLADKDPRDIEKRLLEITQRISGFKAFAYLLSSKTCELTGSEG